MSWSFGHSLGPLPCAVQQTQNPHGVASDAIGGDVGRAGNDQLPRPLDPATTTAFWELHQHLGLYPDTVVHSDCGLWAVRFDVVENRVAVGRPALRGTIP